MRRMRIRECKRRGGCAVEGGGGIREGSVLTEATIALCYTSHAFPFPYLVPLGIGLCSRVPHNLILAYKLLARYSTNTAIHTITQVNTGDELHAVVTMVSLHKKNRYINR